MTDRPIIFSGPMVRAIREGRKTQTRRAIPYQPDSFGEFRWWLPDYCGPARPPSKEAYIKEALRRCPYGAPGDRLCIKENYAVGVEWDNCKPSEIDPLTGGADIWYMADGPKPPLYGKVRPALFMPKWAVRLRPPITDIGVQQVQEISEEDAWTEGIGTYSQGSPALAAIGAGMIASNPLLSRRGFLGGLIAAGLWAAVDGAAVPQSHRGAFAALWDSINAKRGYGWDANPYVWVVTFKVIEPSAVDGMKETET